MDPNYDDVWKCRFCGMEVYVSKATMYGSYPACPKCKDEINTGWETDIDVFLVTLKVCGFLHTDDKGTEYLDIDINVFKKHLSDFIKSL